MTTEPYLAWKINPGDFPLKASISEQIKFLLRFAILAPSTFNAQPWKVKIVNNKLEIYIDLERMPSISDKTGRFALASIGAFTENLLTASKYYDFDCEIKFKSTNFRENNHLITILFTKKLVLRKNTSAKSIKNIIDRKTNRIFDNSKIINSKILSEIKSLSSSSIKIVMLNKDVKDAIINISKIGDEEIWNNKDFKIEHVSWVRNNLSSKHDGMPGFGVGIKTIPSFLARPIILSKKFATLQSKKNIQAITNTSNFIVLCSNNSDMSSINIGMIYEKISLLLSSYAISCAPMGHFIEVEDSKKMLINLIKEETDLMPQMFFRIGYPTKVIHNSPRRNINEIIF